MNSINFDAIQFNLVEEAYSILLTLILLLYMLLSAEYRQKIHRYFRMTLIANIASILGSMTDWLFSGINTPAARAVITFGSSLSFFANGCILTCYFLFFLAFLDKLKKTDPRWVTLPKIIFAVSRSDTAELIKISGLKNALKLAEHIDLPVRTVQRWAQAGQAPEKTLKMIGYILISEME